MWLWRPGRAKVSRTRDRLYPLLVEALEERTVLSFISAPSYAAGLSPVSLAVADFNGDGTADLAVVDSPYKELGTVSILLGRGDGSFQAPEPYAVGSNPTSVAVGDFNDDGRLDLAVANAGTAPDY